jgi:Cupin-like domain
MPMDGSFTMPDPGVPTTPIERLDIESEQAARYVVESRPFVARVDWPALQWSPEYLKAKVGATIVPLRRRNGDTVEVTISEFLDLIQHQREASAEYVMHNYPIMRIWGRDGPRPEMECLLADLPLPPWIRRDCIQEMYVWARNMGAYDNRSHCEPNASAAINVQLRGKKHVWLFPPEDAGLLGAASPRDEMMGPPFFSAGQTVYRPSAEHPGFANVRCYETVLEPGDAIHIPTFWFHWFVHYDLYQMNVNAWFRSASIPVSPVSAEWAYMNALCLSLGGWSVAAERFAALPDETQQLLHKIAVMLIEDRRCTDVKLWGQARVDAPKIVIDPREFTRRPTS